MTKQQRNRMRDDAVPAISAAGRYSDGFHYVRLAPTGNALAWVVAAHRNSGSTFKTRRVATPEEALALVQSATARLIPSTADVPTLSLVTGDESAVPVAAPFSTTYFDCIAANPIAQVWQCNGLVGSKQPVGRRSKSGKPARQTEIPHIVGECAIMLWDQVVRNPDGRPSVYPSWAAADEHALHLYENADEEERIRWRPGDRRVGGTARVDVLFDPAVNGRPKPFSLYLPEFRRPVYEDRTQATDFNELYLSSRVDNSNAKHVHDRLNRLPSFEERPILFRTITGAQTAAECRQGMLEGR